MAATRFLELSIFLLITAAATTTAEEAYVQCLQGGGGELAKLMKQGIVLNLMVNLPYKPETYYCNELTFAGLTMFGYAECTGRDSHGDDSMRACVGCLNLVGTDLIGSCNGTSAGEAWGSDAACYFKIGYSLLDVCPAGTY